MLRLNTETDSTILVWILMVFFPEIRSFERKGNLASFADIIEHFNRLNKSIKGKDKVVPHLYGHMRAFYERLCVFGTQLCNFNVVHLAMLCEIKFVFPKSTSRMTEFSQGFQDFSVTKKRIKLFRSQTDGCRGSGREAVIRIYQNGM